MPKLIIKLPNQQNQRFEIDKAEVLIGRGDSCDLVLPNVSVSREHVRIAIHNKKAEIVDVESGNGISVNNQKVSRAELKSGDEILIGTFVLIYLGDRQRDKFYRGRAVVYLPAYEPRHAKPTQESTFKLSIHEARQLVQEKLILNHGCILDSQGRKLFPESNPLTLGGKTAMVPARGVFIVGIAATIIWNGKRHFIEKNGWFFSMKVNGASKQKSVLEDQDRIQIGRSHFKYLVIKP